MTLTNNRLITNEVPLLHFIDKLDMRTYICVYNNNDEVLCRDWVYSIYKELNNYRDYYVIDINIFSSCTYLVVCTKDELREYQKKMENE